MTHRHCDPRIASGRSRRVRAGLRTGLAAALALTGPARAAAPPAPGYTVIVEHFAFGPVPLTVPLGATVRWNNRDGEPHTIVSLDGKFRSGALDQGDHYEFTFTAPGTYRYVCSIHPQMAGVIVVTAAPVAAAGGQSGASAATRR